MTERIFNIIFEEDEVTWQSLLLETVKSGEMDPWDINISELTAKYIGMIKQAKVENLRISGKVLLAAAILLRIKSTKLLEEDVAGFDALLADAEDALLYNEEGVLPGSQLDRRPYQNLRLYPRTPQPRKKKVSIYDLIDALQKALEVSKRRELRRIIDLPPLEVPIKAIDIDEAINKIHQQIKDWFATKDGKLTFMHLVPDDTRQGRVYTFIPLLHLTNARHIDLEQEKHLGEIKIREAKPQTVTPDASSEDTA